MRNDLLPKFLLNLNIPITRFFYSTVYIFIAFLGPKRRDEGDRRGFMTVASDAIWKRDVMKLCYGRSEIVWVGYHRAV